MSKTIQDLLGYQSLCGLIQATTQGLPKVLPAGFSKNPRKVIMNKGRYTQVSGTRTTSRLSNYMSPAKQTPLKDLAIRDIILLHSFESLQLSPEVFMALRNFDNYNHMGAFGADEVARQVANFKQRLENAELVSQLMALARGVLYQDADGNLLNTSSGSVYTTDFGWTANTNNFEGYGDLATATGSGVSASWATAGTNITKAIRALKAYALKLTGYPIKCAFYGADVPEMFTNNTYISPYLYRNPKRNESILKSGDLEPEFEFEGIKWYPAYEAFYEDVNGTNNTIFGDKQIVFTPEPSNDWWEMLEGSYPVPTTLNVQTDAMAAMKSLKDVHGKFAYAAVTHNPVKVDMYAGHTWTPLMKVPNAVINVADATAAGS